MLEIYEEALNMNDKQSFLTSKEIRWWWGREETSNFVVRNLIHPIPKVIITKSDFTLERLKDVREKAKFLLKKIEEQTILKEVDIESGEENYTFTGDRSYSLVLSQDSQDPLKLSSISFHL